MDVLEDRALDAAVAAIANAARRRMVERLARGPATVGELAALVDVGVPGALKHIGQLVDAGLATRSKAGRTVTVALVPGALAPLAEWAMRTRLFWTNQLDHLAAHLAGAPPGSAARGTAPPGTAPPGTAPPGTAPPGSAPVTADQEEPA